MDKQLLAIILAGFIVMVISMLALANLIAQHGLVGIVDQVLYGVGR